MTTSTSGKLSDALHRLERLIRRDPARRGLIAADEARGPLCPGHLIEASADLAANARRVGIVTGFLIPGAQPAAAETDGPPGAALLADALARLGIDVRLLTDPPCRSAVAAAARRCGLPDSSVITPGTDLRSIENWYAEQQARPESAYSHWIAIERVGPSHTPHSIATQSTRDDHRRSSEFFFRSLVPPTHYDTPFNMRGESLAAHTSPLHRLFELAESDPAARTIGIGDGGNEIGMGNVPWQELQQRLNGPQAAWIPCRVRTTWTIIAGVSNWGGMALAAAMLMRRGHPEMLRLWPAERQLADLQALVSEGPAVDGITRLREATVDGLPFLTYIQPWEGICRVAETMESRGHQ